MNPIIKEPNSIVLSQTAYLYSPGDIDINGIKLAFKYSYAEEYFSAVYPGISDELRREIRKRAVSLKMKKGQQLVNEEKVLSSLYLIRKGLLRGFICYKKEDITVWFGCENEPVVSFDSLMEYMSSKKKIEALEPCTLEVIKVEDLQWLFTNFPEFAIIIRLLFEGYSRDVEERAFISRISAAKERFLYLFKSEKYNQVLRRASLKYVASFLGMRKETLCRIRANTNSTEKNADIVSN